MMACIVPFLPTNSPVVRTCLAAGCVLALGLPGGVMAQPEGTWTPHAPPTDRWGAKAIYDPVGDRMVVFGGFEGGDDTWELSFPGESWTRLAPPGPTPPGREFHSAIHDPLQQRMIVFGGGGDTLRNDVWALSLSGPPTWTQLLPTGSPPEVRERHTAIYDPNGHRMIVFGGQGAAGNLDDTWILDLSDPPGWSQPSGPGGPDPVSGATAIYDPPRSRMILYGGSVGVWAFSLTNPLKWTQPTPAGTPPSDRGGHSAVYDPGGDRMLVFGGGSSLFFNHTDELWELSLSGTPTWSQIIPADPKPLARGLHAGVYDSMRARMVIFGGNLNDDPYYTNEVWELSLSGTPSWQEMAPVVVPPRRVNMASVYDPIRNRILMLGGADLGNVNVYYNDLWSLDLGGPSVWAPLSPGGSTPDSLTYHSAIYDAPRDRVIVLGGLGALNEVWELTLSGGPQWNQLSPSGTPPPARSWHSAVFDASRERMLVFGGGGGVWGPKRNDTWALSLSGTPTWTEILPTGTPPIARAGHSAVFDPLRDRMLVFGGHGAGGIDSPPHYNDVWSLDLSGTPAWVELSPAGTPPATRTDHRTFYDPVRDRMVVSEGGRLGFFIATFKDLWALDLSGSPTWVELNPVGDEHRLGRRSHLMKYDPADDRMVIYGGYCSQYGERDDTWELALTQGTVSVDEEERNPLLPDIHAAYPNPFASQMSIELTLSEDADGRIQIYDLRGRLVKTVLSSGMLPAGRYRYVWEGVDAVGRRVKPGVYFYRVVIGSQDFSRKVVLVN